MNDQINEKGYALIIVLFTIVFITVITAVFLRGALSNAIQEKTLDENNLVVVSAESGTEYYTWELKQVYDMDLLEAKFTKLVNEAIVAKESPIDYERIQRKIASDFKLELTKRADSLIGEGATNLFSDYRHKLIAANVEQTEPNGDILFTVKGTVEGELPENDQQQRKKKGKELEFELAFIIPKVQLADGSTPVDPDGTTTPGGSLIRMPILKEPKATSVPDQPQAPSGVVSIAKTQISCTVEKLNLVGQKCFVTGVHEAQYNINQSEVYVGNTLSSWGTINVANSFINIIQGLTAEKVGILDTKLVVGTSLKGNNSLDINKSKIKVGSDIEGSTPLTIEDSQLTIGGNVTSNNATINQSNLSAKNLGSGAMKITNTDLILDGKLTGNPSAFIEKSKLRVNDFYGYTTTLKSTQLTVKKKLEVQTANVENSIISANEFYSHSSNNRFNDTNLKIATNYGSGGARFESSNLDVGGKLNTGGGLFYVEGSNVQIAGDAHTANGSTIKNSLVNIGGYFLHTSKPLDAENSDIFVGGKVTATNGTNLNDVNMIVLGAYESSTRFKLDGTNLSIDGWLSLGNGGELQRSLLIANKITTDNTLKLDDSIVYADKLISDIMTMGDSNVCVKDLNVRSLSMDDDSKIYYSNTSNHIRNNIIKLSSVDFEKTCGMKSSTTPEDSKQPGKIEWKPPVLDKVIY